MAKNDLFSKGFRDKMATTKDDPFANKGKGLPAVQPSASLPTAPAGSIPSISDVDILDSYGLVGGYYDCNVTQVDNWTKLIDINAVPRKSQPLTLTIDTNYFDTNHVGLGIPAGVYDYCVKIVYGNEFAEHTAIVDIRNGESISVVAARMKVYFGRSAFGIDPTWVVPALSVAPPYPPAFPVTVVQRVGAFVAKGAYGTGRPTRTLLFWGDYGFGGILNMPGGLLLGPIPELARSVTIAGRSTVERELVFYGHGFGPAASAGGISSYYIGANQNPETFIIPGGVLMMVLRTPGTGLPTINPANSSAVLPYKNYAVFELGL
jgi:hypothetical protein